MRTAGGEQRMKILVGTDYSPGAAAAWHHATQLARRFGAELVVIHVAVSDRDDMDGRAARWCGEVGADPASVRVRRGLPWVELSRCADELGADLIVVGSHGDTGYQPLSLGSTAARVGLCAAPPVLVVPPERRRAEYLVTAEQRAVR